MTSPQALSDADCRVVDGRQGSRRACCRSWQVTRLTPEQRAALRSLPPVGADRSGPLGPGLLSSGRLGEIIREIQARLAES